MRTSRLIRYYCVILAHFIMSSPTQISVLKDTADTVEWAENSKHQLDQQEAQRLGLEFDPDSPENKRLVRKLDWRLVVSIKRRASA